MHHLLDRRTGFEPAEEPGGGCQWRKGPEWRIWDDREKRWVKLPRNGPQTEEAARNFCKAGPERYHPYRVDTVHTATRLRDIRPLELETH